MASSNQAIPLNQDRFIRWPEVQQRVGLCRSQCHALAMQGKFPKPIKLVPNGRASAWLESQINQWIAERAAASDGGSVAA